MPKLVVSGLKAYYATERGPVRAVDDVNFSLSDNESLGIVGESACGKSTLGAALMRSMQPPGKIVSGSIVLDGTDVSEMPASEFNSKIRWKKIAMVFQGAMNALDPVYTIESQLHEVLREHRFEGNMEEKIAESLRQVGLDLSVAKRYPHELSGGMKQRVVIAMALLLKPDLLIADEPTTALDVLVQAQIINLLKKLHRENGITVILITHDLALVSQIADKIGIMYAGQLVEVGSTSDIYKNPRHPYTQALIAAMPRLKSNDKKIHFVNGSPPSLLNPPHGCRFYDRCPHAMDACKKDPPEFKTDTGYVRCWLYENNKRES
ncbi:Oligopeptide transport ATP-binding protein OppD [Candidatus Nitrososphaera gargensis Ga9.2]|uniref:Oligopeptide transport ATP-binding protein OppD n=1 Tax=Nitrososphaera gargensis (strain Ga9.2) TaxID=1237085 RepID=K0IIG9_NITGG|nr:ABC transporter ATP-binding protein [Candidatus Nitrososphaera gargensis]AFU58823.1 Oligopeptide transport ATP-binding protein OppD [Candidatus Nitrososphaera gargensis Ga9.2]